MVTCAPRLKMAATSFNLREIYPESFRNGKGNAIVITDSFLVMKFSANAIDTIFLRMKIIKAAFKPDHQEQEEAGSNADRESEGIDEGIAFIPFQVSESGFEIIFKHGRLVVMGSGSINMPVWKSLSHNVLRGLGKRTVRI